MSMARANTIRNLKAKDNRKVNFKKVMTGLNFYFKNFKKTALIIFVISLIGAGLSAISIWFNGELYDKWLFDIVASIGGEGLANFFGFVWFIVGFTICSVISIASTWISSVIALKMSENGCFNLRKDLFKKLQRLPIKYFDSTPSGEIISRASNDVDNIAVTISQNMANLIFWTLQVIIISVFMFLTNWILSLITLITLPAMLISSGFIIGKIQKYFKKQQESLGKLNSKVEENISGLKIISLFKMEEKTAQEFDEINAELTRTSWVANMGMNLLMPISYFFNNIGFVILAIAGIVLTSKYEWIQNQGIFEYKTYASLIIVFNMYARSSQNPINQIVSTLSNVFLAIASADRVFEIINEEPEKDDINAQPLSNFKGLIEAKNLYFGYVKDKMVLKNINFVAKPNSVTAFVGPTGAGKTTIVNLITKFYEINAGELLIDGISTTKISRESLRQNISIVLQDTFLFNTSIKENLRFAKLNATNEEIEEAAKKANVHEFIMQLPEQYDTILKDNAENISQGQRQLLAIARAFLVDSKIVILDEATSSIDTKTELRIQNALEKLSKNRTTFMIAHRLSTIKNADNIVVLKDGEIVEQGTHQGLIDKDGFYAQLYNSQFKGEQI